MMCMLIPVAIQSSRILSHVVSVPHIMLQRIATHNIMRVTTLKLLGVPAFLLYPEMYWPSILCSISHFCILGELLAKQYNASSRNGVVGSIGNGIPMIPRISAVKPDIRRKAVLGTI